MHNPDKYQIIKAGKNELDNISFLWQKLNDLHFEISAYFKNRFKTNSWEKRKKALIDKSKNLLLEYAIDKESKLIIGYCISTIDKNNPTVGEIDSVYIEEKYRKSGLGRTLVENAITWLNSEGVETQKLLVGVGNEKVIDFYRQFGFQPLHIVMQKT